jgi:hypothetical protein
MWLFYLIFAWTVGAGFVLSHIFSAKTSPLQWWVYALIVIMFPVLLPITLGILIQEQTEQQVTSDIETYGKKE